PLSVGKSGAYFVFFFFQAEDGIRDATVTGVQTCALPIYLAQPELLLHERQRPLDHLSQGNRLVADGGHPSERAQMRDDLRGLARSEERRVGKECRCGWWGEDYGERRV